MTETRVEGSTVVIKLPSGEETRIDATDFPLISPHRWHRAGGPEAWYAATAIGRKTVYMHRLITGAVKGETVDHINHDTMDNRRLNLRKLSNAENNQNRKGAYRSKNSTGVRGVALDYRDGATYLKTRVMLDGKTYSGPYFEHSKQGLRDAAQWVFDKRRELMPFSSHDQPFVSEEALSRVPDVARARVFARGSAHGMSKVTEQQVIEIRRRVSEGEPQARICEELGLSSASVSRIVNRVDWNHIKGENHGEEDRPEAAEHGRHHRARMERHASG